MGFSSWLRNRTSNRAPRGRQHRPAAPRCHLRLEALEDRWLPSTLTVLNNLDSGPGSLRAEIAAAKSGDTIVFAPGLNGQTITLTSGELAIAKSLNIQGPGASQLTVSGGGTWRVFEVDGARTTVTLSGFTISQGAALLATSQGGGVLNFGALTVSNCTLSGNAAAEAGGGIMNWGGALTVSDCTLSGNAAPGGGGIYNGPKSSLTVRASTLSANSALVGGGIENVGTLLVSASNLSGNFATWGDAGSMLGADSGVYDGLGGGIFNAGSATVSNSTLSGNSANDGGGIYNSSQGTLTLTGSTLTGNSAVLLDGTSGAGGGLSNAGKAKVKSSTLSGNSAAIEGGGIFNDARASLTLSGSAVTGNGAPVGADLYNLGHLTLHNSTIGLIGP